jgi:hypothetical protein
VTKDHETYTDKLAHALAVFDGASGVIKCDCRSLEGIGHETLALTPGPMREGVPMPLLEMIAANWGVRVPPFTQTIAGDFVALPFAFALWHPPTTLRKRQRLITPEGRRMITEALAPMPPASLVIWAGTEAWAGWRLTRPITNQHQALALVNRLTARLGSGPIQTLSGLTLPFCGAIRNWTIDPVEHVTIAAAAPAIRYTTHELEEMTNDVEVVNVH